MAWVTPKTWTAGEVVGETDMNTHVRDNLNFLFSPSFGQIVTASAGNLTITATTAIPIDTANLSIALTTYGGSIHLYLAGRWSAPAGDEFSLGFVYDGTAVHSSVTGLARVNPGGGTHIAIDGWITGLASGAHTFQPTWHVAAAGDSARMEFAISPTIFWAREG